MSASCLPCWFPGGNDLELGDDDDDTTMGADTAAGRQGRDDPGETYGKEGSWGGRGEGVVCGLRFFERFRKEETYID